MKRIYSSLFAIIIVAAMCFNFGSVFAENNYKVFTLDELSKYNGKNGQKAYIGLNGYVYDISGERRFRNGTHTEDSRVKAGSDVTDLLQYAPKSHLRESFYDKYPIVGVLPGNQNAANGNVNNNSANNAQNRNLRERADNGGLASREAIEVFGFITLGLFIITSIASFRLRKLKASIKSASPENKAALSNKYKRQLSLHCIISILLLIPILFHIKNSFDSFDISLGWLLVFLYLFIIITGVLKKYFKVKVLNNKNFNYSHGILAVVTGALTIVHMIDKLF